MLKLRSKLLYNITYIHDMKYLIYSLLLLAIISTASAGPGAGLSYGIESDIVSSNQKLCVEYGLYNPFDVDSKISLSAEGEISEFVFSSDSLDVPAGTSIDDAYNAKICYQAPDLRIKKCKVPFILCEYKCEIEEKLYTGQVLASPESVSSMQSTGSAVGMSIAAPFSLLVKCEAADYNYWPIIFIALSILLLIIIFLILRWRRKKARKDEYRKRYEYWYKQQQLQRQSAQPPQQGQQQYQNQYSQTQQPYNQQQNQNYPQQHQQPPQQNPDNSEEQ